MVTGQADIRLWRPPWYLVPAGCSCPLPGDDPPWQPPDPGPPGGSDLGQEVQLPEVPHHPGGSKPGDLRQQLHRGRDLAVRQEFNNQSISQVYDQIWGKTKYGFKKAYEEFYDKIDWVMKADDDTYVILENLRFLLSEYNSSDPIWFGCEFDVIVKEGYMSGGAGYVLSKGKCSQYT